MWPSNLGEIPSGWELSVILRLFKQREYGLLHLIGLREHSGTGLRNNLCPSKLGCLGSVVSVRYLASGSGGVGCDVGQVI